MKNMFPKNNKKHAMNTRNPEMFEITKSRTERLNMSSIPFMQKMLYQHFTEKEFQ